MVHNKGSCNPTVCISIPHLACSPGTSCNSGVVIATPTKANEDLINNKIRKIPNAIFNMFFIFSPYVKAVGCDAIGVRSYCICDSYVPGLKPFIGLIGQNVESTAAPVDGLIHVGGDALAPTHLHNPATEPVIGLNNAVVGRFKSSTGVNLPVVEDTGGSTEGVLTKLSSSISKLFPVSPAINDDAKSHCCTPHVPGVVHVGFVELHLTSKTRF